MNKIFFKKPQDYKPVVKSSHLQMSPPIDLMSHYYANLSKMSDSVLNWRDGVNLLMSCDGKSQFLQLIFRRRFICFANLFHAETASHLAVQIVVYSGSSGTRGV